MTAPPSPRAHEQPVPRGLRRGRQAGIVHTASARGSRVN